MPRDIARLRGLLNASRKRACQDSGGGSSTKGGRTPAGSKSNRPAFCILAIAILVAMLTGTALAQSVAYKPEYRLSVAVGGSYAWARGAERWAQIIRDRTAGRINVRVLPGASAVGGDPSNELEALRTRGVDLAVGSALNWAPRIQPLTLFALPFLVGDDRHLDALTSGPVGATIFRAMTDAGIVPLAWGDNGFRQLASRARSTRLPADFKGLRLRVSGPPILDDIVATLGAVPVRQKWSEAQKAVLDGSLHAVEIGLATYVTTKAHTLGLDRLLLWNIVAEPLIFAANKAAWEEWSETDREIVRIAALAAAQGEIAEARAASAAALERIAKDLRGTVTVDRLDASQRAAFAAALEPVTKRWTASVGEALVGDAMKAMEGASAPR